jgi:hypothetical protein
VSWHECSAEVQSLMERSSDDDSDEDDTAALMAELAKIKQERADEKAKLVSGLPSFLCTLTSLISHLLSRHPMLSASSDRTPNQTRRINVIEKQK